MIIEKMRDFIQQAKRGKRFVYHRSESVNIQPQDVFSVAWNAYKAGRVTLVQRRAGPVGSNVFEYLMVRL